MDRLNFYLGNILNVKFKKINLQSIDEITNIRYDEYKKPLSKLLLNYSKNIKIKCIVGDNFYNKNCTYSLVKNRCCYGHLKNESFNDTKDGVILRSLNFNRHWANYYRKFNELPFEEKKNKLIWRGATTGQNNYTANRFDLVKKWFNVNEDIDIGFNLFVQDKEKNYLKFFKKTMKIEEMLNFKYILSVQGNDKDSGLQWKLNSNSVVLMAKPTICSWLMETTLIPNYHYILLKNDFSDLEEKLNWCKQNQTKCLKIIKNANKFMDQFKDNELEEELERDVLHNYLEIVKQKKKKKIGLIIPYRDRKEHLDIFIPYITQHLESQKIDYKIIVVEQCNKNPFNRSKLLNIGAKYVYDEVDYLCFHDVDFIPDKNVSYDINNYNAIINCSQLIDNRNNKIKNSKFFYGMNFDKYFQKINFSSFGIKNFGGVTIIRKDIWKDKKWNEIFEGWGREDDEYYYRINQPNHITYHPQNRYISLNHKSNSIRICGFKSKTLILNSYFLNRIIKNHSIKFILTDTEFTIRIIKNHSKKFILTDTEFTILDKINKSKYELLKVDFQINKINYKYYIVSHIKYFITKIWFLISLYLLYYIVNEFSIMYFYNSK